MLEALKQGLRPNPRPLMVLKTDLWEESGRGRGILSEVPRGALVCGMDVSRETCLAAREYEGRPVQIIQANIQALPFRNAVFDMVADLSTIDHVPLDGALLAVGEYTRVLRNGGSLLVTFWRDTPLTRFALRHMRSAIYRLGDTQFLLSEKALRSKVREGFDILEEYCTGMPMVAGALMTRYPVASRRLDRVLPRALARVVVALEYTRLSRFLFRAVAAQYTIIARRRTA